MYLTSLTSPGPDESRSLPPVPSDSGGGDGQDDAFPSQQPLSLEEAWGGAEGAAPSSGKLRSRSCDDLLNDGHSGGGRGAPRSESAGSLLCDGTLPGSTGSAHSLPPLPRRRAHDSPGFLQLYRTMHQIDRAQLVPSEVIRSVRARILELERQPHAPHHHHRRRPPPPWGPSSGGAVPRDTVPNRVSEYERLIKSKSMPNLDDGELPSGATTPGGSSSRASSGGGATPNFPKRRFSIESLLEEDVGNGSNAVGNPVAPLRRPRSPPEGQPRSGPEPTRGRSYPADAHRALAPLANADYSDSEEQDAVASDLSDFIQVEGSSFCSESDFDHCSLTSSESLCGPSAHHHHHHHHQRHQYHHHHHHLGHQSVGQSQGYQHRHLISSCKGRCPASYTRFTTMLRHERERARLEHQRHSQQSRAGSGASGSQSKPQSSRSQQEMSKLAFLVSPVPFRRKKGSPPTARRSSSCRERGGRPKSKQAMYEALDAALRDIYEHIQAERGHRGSRPPDESILRRILAELMPHVPERSSSLRERRGCWHHRSSSQYLDGSPTRCAPYRGESASSPRVQSPLSACYGRHLEMSNNNDYGEEPGNGNGLYYSGGEKYTHRTQRYAQCLPSSHHSVPHIDFFCVLLFSSFILIHS